jgi:hypothetical protein
LTQKDSQKEQKSTSRFAHMAQNDHDPLMPRCDDTLDSWLERTSAIQPSDPDLLPGLDEGGDDWSSSVGVSQASGWPPQVSAYRGIIDGSRAAEVATGSILENSVMLHTQYNATRFEYAPSTHTSMQPRGSRHRDNDRWPEQKDVIVPIPSSWSILGPDPSSVNQLPEETVYRNHTPDQSETTILSTDDPSADPPSHETVSSSPTDQNLSMSPILSGSLHCANNLQLYRNAGVKHLWYAMLKPGSGSNQIRDGLEIKFSRPCKEGVMHIGSNVHNTVRNRVSKIRSKWAFLVSVVNPDHTGDPLPAFSLLADDHPVISLLTKRALTEISEQLKVVMMPIRRACRYKKGRTAWRSKNRRNWNTTISDLNSLMAVLDLALRVRDILKYEAGTRLTSYARLDEAEIAKLLGNKRDILLYQAET